MDLMKIANDTEATYLDKVAATVDAFAAGEITGPEADAFATEIGIDPEDLLAFHQAHYGDDTEDMEKVASDEEVGDFLAKTAFDEDSTYITKCAAIVDLAGLGFIDADDAFELAKEAGVDFDDVDAIFDDVYGDELEKEAGRVKDTIKGAGRRVSEMSAAVARKVRKADRALIRASGGMDAMNVGRLKDMVKDNVRGAGAKVRNYSRKHKLGTKAAYLGGAGALAGGGYLAAQREQ